MSRAVWGGPAPCGPRVRAVLLLLPDPSTPSFLPPSLYPFLPIFLPPSLAPSPLHLPPLPFLSFLPPSPSFLFHWNAFQRDQMGCSLHSPGPGPSL